MIMQVLIVIVDIGFTFMIIVYVLNVNVRNFQSLEVLSGIIPITNMVKNKTFVKAQKKSSYIDKWAETMTKHGISLKTKKSNPWRFANFRGPKGGESAGAIDLLAVRRKIVKYKTKSDLLEIILIQVKGSATKPKWPTSDHVKRMKNAKKSCNAKQLVLVRYTYKKEKQYYYLTKGNEWMESSIEGIFS